MTAKLTVGAGLAAIALVVVVGGGLSGESSSAGVFPGSAGKIIFESDEGGDNEVLTINPDGSGRVPLTTNVASDGTASFSGDGERIVFMRDGNISVMDANGRNVTSLNVVTGDDPSFSPDGRKIVFSNNDGGGDFEIFVMNADGSNQLPLTANAVSDAEPSWSPDGRRIVFVRDGGVGGEIFAMNADGSGQVPLTTNAVDDAEPSWSPDGQKVLFVRDDGDGEIFTMSPTGANQTPLTTNAVIDEDPVFSPNGTRVAFIRDDGTDLDIFLMKADGSDQIPLTNDTVSEEDPDWQALNPPACTLSGRRRQRSFRFVLVKITCSEDASVALRGTVRVPVVPRSQRPQAATLTRRFALRPRRLEVMPAVPSVARLVVPRRARRALKKAARAGRRGRATVLAIATDDLGQRGRARKTYTFRLRR